MRKPFDKGAQTWLTLPWRSCAKEAPGSHRDPQSCPLPPLCLPPTINRELGFPEADGGDNLLSGAVFIPFVRCLSATLDFQKAGKGLPGIKTHQQEQTESHIQKEEQGMWLQVCSGTEHRKLSYSAATPRREDRSADGVAESQQRKTRPLSAIENASGTEKRDL